ncbi:unnamed protein product, partial [Iphiclides podalirius]
MSKKTVYVLLCSVLIVVLFCVFCYLLNIVNPEVYLTNTTDPRRLDLSPTEELSAKDDVHYGLEKAPETYKPKAPYESEIKWDDYRRKSYPVQIPIVTPTDKQTPVTVIVYPSKDHRRSVETNNVPKYKDRSSKNVLLKIVDDNGQARMEVIVDSGQIHYKNQLNKPKENNGELEVYEIKSNNTLLYNIQEQSLKIVDDGLPKVVNVNI